MKILAACLAATLSACASVPILGPAFSPQSKTVVGAIVKVERQDDYEQPCRLICRFMGGESARAYLAEVADNSGRTTPFWFFAMAGSRTPIVGDSGSWPLTPTEVVGPFTKCSQYGCPSEFGYQLTPANWPTVRDMGECADVSSPSCPVRDYWPRGRQAEAVGTSVYWLVGNDSRVCFVTRSQFNRAVVGRPFECLWRERLQ